MSNTKVQPVMNRLLSVLPHGDLKRFLKECEPVELLFSAILNKPGQRIEHAWFPTGSFISLLVPVDQGRRLEVGLVGDEGMVGTSLFLGVPTSPLHAVVQGKGAALRITAASFGRQLAQSPALDSVLRRYLHVVLEQLAQTAACTRFHVVEARLARWLLMTGDRAYSKRFHITQAFIASMLGVRRVGVTRAANALQARQLISYHRGEMAILDPDGLAALACSCYAADNASYARLLGGNHP